MSLKSLMFAVGLFASVPAMADTASTAQAARDANNLNVLQAYYPSRALAAREQGSVGFQVKIDASGQPTECQVTKSSGYPLLDKETCDIITLRAVFKRPENISGSQVATYQGVINWTLPASPGVPTAKPATQMASAAAPEKKVCRKVTRTGSLVSTDRVCMTPSQWRKQSDESKEEWEALQGRKGSTNGQ